MSVRLDGGTTRHCSQKDEGRTWRRVAPAVGTLVEVEVDEDGDVSWRSALVRQRFKDGDFTAVVLYPDGKPDEDFVEKYSLQDEGVEWRYPKQRPLKKGKAATGASDITAVVSYDGKGEVPCRDSASARRGQGSSKGVRFSAETIAVLEAGFSEQNGVTPTGDVLAEVRHGTGPPIPRSTCQLTMPLVHLQMKLAAGIEAHQLQNWFSNRRQKAAKQRAQSSAIDV